MWEKQHFNITPLHLCFHSNFLLRKRWTRRITAALKSNTRWQLTFNKMLNNGGDSLRHFHTNKCRFGFSRWFNLHPRAVQLVFAALKHLVTVSQVTPLAYRKWCGLCFQQQHLGLKSTEEELNKNLADYHFKKHKCLLTDDRINLIIQKIIVTVMVINNFSLPLYDQIPHGLSPNIKLALFCPLGCCL